MGCTSSKPPRSASGSSLPVTDNGGSARNVAFPKDNEERDMDGNAKTGEPQNEEDCYWYADIENSILEEVVDMSSEMKIEAILIQLQERMTYLEQVKDFSSLSQEDAIRANADLMFFNCCLHRDIEEESDQVASYLADQNFQRLFLKIWADGFKQFAGEKTLAHMTMEYSAVILRNIPNNCEGIIQKYTDDKICQDILKYLNDLTLEPKDVDNEVSALLIEHLIYTLYNFNLYASSEARGIFRENRAVEILQRVRNSKDPEVRMDAEILLASIINEDENELIHSEDTSFDFLLTALKDALESNERQLGFEASGLAYVLNKLAANDSNKVRMVEQGVLPLYVKMLQPERTEKAQLRAAEGLWILAFKCRDEIKREEGCLQALQNLVDASQNEDVSKQARGALWTLNAGEKTALNTVTESTVQAHESMNEEEGQEEEQKELQHIMISYPWKYKPTMLRIRDQLRDAGFRVWMDVDHMSGNILDAMADAVEKSAAVIICLSQNYKESPSCRAEAEYTYSLRKDIVPLRLEYNYKPDGWLGFIAGSKLFFDFGKEEKFTNSMSGLIRELGERGRGNAEPGEPHVAPRVHAPLNMGTQPIISLPNSGTQPDISNWMTGDVAEWLSDIGLEHQKAWFKDVDESLLLEYRNMQRDSVQVFDVKMGAENFSLPDIVKFKKGLRQLPC